MAKEFKVKINDKEFTVKFSLGLISEMYQLIMSEYVKRLQVAPELKPQQIERIKKLQGKLAKTKDEAEQESIKDKINDIYITAYLEEAGVAQQTMDQKLLEAYESIKFDLLALLLTKRDNKGNIIQKVTASEIMYDEKYVDAEDKLEELLEFAFGIFIKKATKNLKKDGVQEQLKDVVQKMIR